MKGIVVACALLSGCSPAMIYPLMAAAPYAQAAQAAQQQQQQQQAQYAPRTAAGQAAYAEQERQQRIAEEQARQNAAQWQAAADAQEAEKKRQLDAIMNPPKPPPPAPTGPEPVLVQVVEAEPAKPPEPMWAGRFPLVQSEQADEPPRRKLSAAERQAIADKKSAREAQRAAAKKESEARTVAAARATAEARTAYCGDSPKSGYRDLIRFYRDQANDPDSVEFAECSGVLERPMPTCWVVTCKIRESNAFGAKMITPHFFKKSDRDGWQEIRVLR